jgi:ribosomal protein S12 methylthiotransferase
MLGVIKNGGFEITDDESSAEIIIVNTCCFIDDAKRESIDTILEAARWKDEGQCRRLIVTGCLAQRYREEVLQELPEVDAVVGVGHIKEILSAFRGEPSVLCGNAYSHPETERVRLTPGYSAYLKIADGCDTRWTYCEIPSVRGRYISRPIEVLAAEARALAADGVKELILIAQDTTNYGADLYGEARLAALLRELCAIDGLEWLRLHYCYPERITDGLLDLIAREDKICNYLDIPIQHCDGGILRKMGRRGDRAALEGLIGNIRKKIPGVTLRTTLITGFPTETEEQYLEMLDFIKKTRFERLGVFAYSQEEGTPAAAMDGQVDEETKERRRELLMFAQAEVTRELSEQKTGETVRVLTEGYDEVIKRHYGRSAADSADIDGKVFYSAERRVPAGEFVEVTIENAMDYDLFGRVATR